MKIETFISNAIINQSPKKLGDLMQKFTQEVYKLDNAYNIHHDLYDSKKCEEIEVKCSRVLTNCKKAKNKSYLDFLTQEKQLCVFSKRLQEKFDCNIQQIQPKEFKTLYYYLFFKETILLFEISSSSLREDEFIGYSNFQHYKNKDEGQFHIKPNNINHHLNTYLKRYY